MENKAKLLNFTIELNRDGNLEFNLDCADTRGVEATLRALGDPSFGPKITNVVRHYFRHLSEKIKEERT